MTQQQPGTDVAIFNAMAHVIIREGWLNEAFIAGRTEGYEALARAVVDWMPARASLISGVGTDDIVEAARLYAQAQSGMIFWAMGITQHISGTDNVKALSNLALLTGHIGRPGTGLNPRRGQNNVQGACDAEAAANLLTNDAVDPTAKIPEYKVCAVRLEKVGGSETKPEKVEKSYKN